MGVPQYDVLVKLVKHAELNARGPSLRADSDDAFRLRLQLPLAFNSAFTAADVGSRVLAGHVAVLRDECSAADADA